MPQSAHTSLTIWPLLLFFIVAATLVAGIIILSSLLGQRHRERTTDDPYESGIIPTGAAHIRFDIKFYLMAMFFVIFDLEAVFVYLWAANARLLGWAGYIEIVVFIGVLLAALFYLWQIEALDWGTRKHRQRIESSQR